MMLLFGLAIIAVLLLKFQARFAHLYTKDHALVHVAHDSSQYDTQSAAAVRASSGEHASSQERAPGFGASGAEHDSSDVNRGAAEVGGAQDSADGGGAAESSTTGDGAVHGGAAAEHPDSVGPASHNAAEAPAPQDASGGSAPAGADDAPAQGDSVAAPAADAAVAAQAAAVPVADGQAERTGESAAQAGAAPPAPAQKPAAVKITLRAGRAPSSRSGVYWDSVTEDDAYQMPRWFFQLANKDRVGSFRPLCVSKAGSMAVEGNSTCAGVEMEDWFRRHCKDVELVVQKDMNLGPMSLKSARDIGAHGGSGVKFIKQASLVLGLDKHCIKREKYLSRIMFLFHVRRNFRLYNMERDVAAPTNIVVVCARDVLRTLLRPEASDYWFHFMLSVAVHPLKFEILQTPEEMAALTETSVVAAVPKAYVVPSSLFAKQMLCFDHAVVPTMLRGGRLFVSDLEYPVATSWMLPAEISPNLQALVRPIPADALNFRANALELLFEEKGEPGEYVIDKRIVLIERVSPDGNEADPPLNPDDREALKTLLSEKGAPGGFAFEVLNIYGMPIANQLEVLSSAAILVGVTGDLLLAEMHLPPLAVILKIARYGVAPEELQKGLNCGVTSFHVQLRTGSEAPMMIQYSSQQECIQNSKECKSFYDSAPIVFLQEDWADISSAVSNAMSYYRQLEGSMALAAQAAQAAQAAPPPPPSVKV